MKKLILIIFLISNTLLNGQTYSSIVSDQEIYQFINWEVSNSEKISNESKFKKKRVIGKEISKWYKSEFYEPDSSSEYYNADMMFYIFKEENHLDTLFSKEDMFFLLLKLKIKTIVFGEKLLKNQKLSKGTEMTIIDILFHYSQKTGII